MAPREAGGSGGGLELLMSRCARVDAIWLMTCSLAGGAVVAEVAFEMTKGESRLCVKPTSQADKDLQAVRWRMSLTDGVLENAT